MINNKSISNSILKLINTGKPVPIGTYNETDVAESNTKDFRRSRLTNEIKAELRDFYTSNNYPTREEYNYLFKKTGVPLKNLKIWFQNQRAKKKVDGIKKVRLVKQQARCPCCYTVFETEIRINI